MRDAVQGIRPLGPFMIAQFREQVASGNTSRAVVTAMSALTSLHARFPAGDLIRLLDELSRRPADPGSSRAVMHIMDVAMFNCHDSGGLSGSQVDSLLAVAARYQLSDRALAISEHALRKGWPISSRAAVALIDAVGHKVASKAPGDVLAAYRGAVGLLHAAGVPLDALVAKALFRLLTGPHATAVRAARTAADSLAAAEEEPPAAAEAPGPTPSPSSSGAGSGSGSKSSRAQVEGLLRAAGQAADPLLEEAFTLVRALPDAAVQHGGVLPELLLACLRRGKRGRALQLVGAMQARDIPVPTAVFNALIASDAFLHPDAASSGAPAAAAGRPSPPSRSSGGSSSSSAPGVPVPAEVHLRLMREAGAVPDVGTLEALAKAFLYRPGFDGSGVAGYLTSMAQALGVPLSQRALGIGAFHAAKAGNGREVRAVVGLLQHVPRGRADAPPPRWLRKLGNFLVDNTAAGDAGHQRAAAARSRT